jgi:formate-dependent nitrite reductase membrane component NrfD
MSWGAWTLLVITPLSMIWSASYLRELVPTWDWKFLWLKKFEKFVISYRSVIAWMMVVLAVILGIYTGILLSAFNARPLWNTSIMGFLFLASGLSSGAAVIMWMSKDKMERHLISKIDILLIGIELFLIIHLFMGFLAGPEVQIEAASLFLGGRFTVIFWVVVVGLGVILPGILEILELRGKKIPIYIPALLILIGGLIFRYVIVEAGQLTGYIH